MTPNTNQLETTKMDDDNSKNMYTKIKCLEILLVDCLGRDQLDIQPRLQWLEVIEVDLFDPCPAPGATHTEDS